MQYMQYMHFFPIFRLKTKKKQKKNNKTKKKNKKTTFDFEKSMVFPPLRDLMAQRLARRAEDRDVPGSSPTQD